jgi:hypothetical protein
LDTENPGQTETDAKAGRNGEEILTEYEQLINDPNYINNKNGIKVVPKH